MRLCSRLSGTLGEGKEMKPNFPASVSVALVGGLVHAYVLVFLWGYIAAYSPLLKWLLGFGLRSGSLQIAVFSIDFLTNVVLSLPAAYVLVKLRPAKLALFLSLAVVPAFIWFNVHLVGSEVLAEFWRYFAPGWVQQLSALPVAAYLLRFITRPGAPNNALHATCETARA